MTRKKTGPEWTLSAKTNHGCFHAGANSDQGPSLRASCGEGGLEWTRMLCVRLRRRWRTPVDAHATKCYGVFRSISVLPCSLGPIPSVRE